MNMEEQKKIRVVGAAIVRDGRILVAQRPWSEKVYKSLRWEFPGGKIEPGETEEQAIVREISEELDCAVEVVKLLPELEYEYPDFVLQLTVCICRLRPGAEPKRLEHNALRWVTPMECAALYWAAADACFWPRVVKCLDEMTD